MFLRENTNSRYQNQQRSRNFYHQKIEKDELLICSQSIISTTNPTEQQVESLFRTKSQKFTALQQETYQKLQKSYGDSPSSAFVINAFKMIPNLQEEYKIGLFLEPSFMNHSCVPNIIQVYSGEFMYVFAAKQILEGQEICCCYLYGDNFWWLQGRQNYLRSFKFTCDCSLCQFQATPQFIKLQFAFDKLLRVKRSKNEVNIDEFQYLSNILLETQFCMVDGFYELVLFYCEKSKTHEIMDIFLSIYQKLDVIHRPTIGIVIAIIDAIQKVGGNYKQLKNIMYQFELERMGSVQHIYRDYGGLIDIIGKFEQQ
ncbi:SET domain-containing protein [Spironucleus salmonicida]|uniref:SET domain-containing protein n=1 Tax=Spironucleus salmonicida TaxID=348837 RepID=V6LQ49_9EUKA|nr:SET domain-containing protein [Spironucleus salmonicida]|eukprot:EST46373.1 SET domain-containing protein [Spironucleus salmonicida]